MIFPKWIKPGDTVGVTAPSAGIVKAPDIARFENAKKQLEKRGYSVVMTPNVFQCDEKGRSSEASVRGKEFNSLIIRNDVSVVISAKGGDYLMEMLPYVDAEAIKRNPKWLQGYSDNTSLLYYVTTKLGIATIYGCNFKEFGMEPWHPAVSRALGVLEGRQKEQTSFDFYESSFHDRITGLEGYWKDAPVLWKSNRGDSRVEMSGRLLGGCLDVLDFIAGTRYDGTLSFCETYKNDGILWFFESFSTTSEMLTTKLWQFKELGWFRHASGIIFGRPCFFNTFNDTSYEEAARLILDDLNIPIIFDADIGHQGPQFSTIIGAKAKVVCENGAGCLTYLA